MIFLKLNVFDDPAEGDTTSLSYNELVACKQARCSVFYSGPSEIDSYFCGTLESSYLDGLKMFHNMFSNTYTEYALKSNKLFFYIEISSPNFTYKNCMPSVVRGAFAKVIANKIINGLLKHFPGMIDLIFADLSCERDNISDFSEIPKFKFIITFNTYFLLKSTSVAFQDSSFVNSNNNFYYLSEHNGLDFFLNHLKHIIESDDNCPFLVTSVKHLDSQPLIVNYWQKFFFLHGDRLNIVHIFFYSATSPIWLNLEDPTFYPFVNYVGEYDPILFPVNELLIPFSFLTLADSISTDSKNIFYTNADSKSKYFLYYAPVLVESTYSIASENYTDDSAIAYYTNQLKLEYGLSFLVRRTLSLPYIYDQFWSYCGHRCRRKEENYTFLYNDTFNSIFIHLISTYFMLQGVQFLPAGGFLKVNLLAKYEDDIYSSFVPYEINIMSLTKDSIPVSNGDVSDSIKLCDISYFIKYFIDRIYLNLLSVLPELKYYNNSVRFYSSEDFLISTSSDACLSYGFSNRAKYHEVILRYCFKELYSNFINEDYAYGSGDFILFLVNQFFSKKLIFNDLITLDEIGICFSSVCLDYSSTPDGYNHLYSKRSFNAPLPISVFPSVGFSDFKVSSADISSFF